MLAILRGTPAAAGLAPSGGLDWIPGFLRRAVTDLGLGGLNELSLGEPERIALRAGILVVNAPMVGFCGGSTARVIHLPWQRLRCERRLCACHELLHSAGARLGVRHTEADWWLATAAVAHLAVRGGGALRFPTWFVGEIPREIVALF